MGLLRIDQNGGRCGIGFRSQMHISIIWWIVTPHEAIRHVFSAGICGVGKARGHQRRLVVCRFAGAIMREAVKEPGPTVDFCKQAGDPDPQHQNITPATEPYDPVAFLFADRRDRQALLEIAASGIALAAAALASSFSFESSVAVRSVCHSAKLSGMASPSRLSARIRVKIGRGRR